MAIKLTRRALLTSAMSSVATLALADAPLTSLRPVARPGSNEPILARIGTDEMLAEANLGGVVGFVVADARTGEMLEMHAADAALPPASVTKSVTALYALETLGATPVIVCGPPVSQALMQNYRVHEIRVGEHQERELEAFKALYHYQPDAVLSIERPGQAADGGYYNMRGESISARTACFDTFINNAKCPTIGIGDGGNEIGMGNITEALKGLDIVSATTRVDELLIADVSNWGAYGILAMLSVMNEIDLLASVKPREILEYLSNLGSVDGVTRQNELTEDGLDPCEGEAVLLQLRQIIGMA